MRGRAVICLLVALAGCGKPSGPETTDTLSSSLPTLRERVAFLQRYVPFRGEFRRLGFHVLYRNNGGGLVPAPSDWDIRIVAVVPAEELPRWIPAGVPMAPPPDLTWLAGVPESERAAGMSEWYVEPNRVVGVDRVRSVVVYRSRAQ